MQCPGCQAQNRQGAQFCHACGTPLDAACPACGARLEAGSRFCDACGSQVGVTAKPGPRFESPGSYTP
ncbi:MAG: zinc ribbon domain-containing protein, partial [Candidatus Rokubacteria bacterium]|nr:zinc ribbon domain-containing protein [Candidatus Rokubacteria bacterium]